MESLLLLALAFRFATAFCSIVTPGLWSLAFRPEISSTQAVLSNFLPSLRQRSLCTLNHHKSFSLGFLRSHQSRLLFFRGVLPGFLFSFSVVCIIILPLALILFVVPCGFILAEEDGSVSLLSFPSISCSQISVRPLCPECGFDVPCPQLVP